MSATYAALASARRLGPVRKTASEKPFITDAIDAGVPARVVSQYVGHDSMEITMCVYYTCRRSTVEEAIDILNRSSDRTRAGGLKLVEGGTLENRDEHQKRHQKSVVNS